MHRLGYTRYVAQGGDVGALVTDLMGRQAVEGLVGYHLNLLTAVLAIGDQLPKESEQERAAAEALATFRQDGFGYFLEMATRPQTIGYALLDSPVALAAWLLDHDTDSYYKISRAFVDGEPVGNLTRDTIVDNITLYWLTGTAASAARSYWEDGRALAAALASGQAPPAVTVPVGFTTFPGEIWAAPRSWVETVYPDLAYFNEVDRGGHFAAWEEPELFSDGDAGRIQVAALIDSGLASRGATSGPPTGGPEGNLAPSGGRRSRDVSLFGARRHPRTAPLPVEGRLPGFEGATGWLNSSPLTPEGLAGKVVLVDFWTYTCINWLRTLAFVRAWSEKYRDRGLVVVGVHTPEFPFEREVENVREAAQAMRVEYPIALDSDYGVWSAFGNQYWPAVYIADAEGRIRYHHFGEGEYDDGEWMIQHLLREAGSEGIDERARLRHRGGFGGAGRLDEPGLSRDLPRLPAGAEPRLSRRCRVRRASRLRRARVAAAQQLGPGRKLDDRGAGERAERSRRANRLPLPCPRRPSRPALASGHGRPVPRARRRRASRRTRTAWTSTNRAAEPLSNPGSIS